MGKCPAASLLKNYLKTDCPVKVSNDANCAALGEAKAGAARGVDNVVLLTLGTGVGGGVIIDGKIFEGGHAGGAELGHTSLIMGVNHAHADGKAVWRLMFLQQHLSVMQKRLQNKMRIPPCMYCAKGI